MAQKFSSTGLTGLSGSSITSPFGGALQNKINPSPLKPLNTGLKGLSGGSVVSPFQASSGSSILKPPAPTPSTIMSPTTGTISGNVTGGINQPSGYSGPTDYMTSSDELLFEQMRREGQNNSSQESPYLGSVGIQQSYAGGGGNPAVNASIGGLQGIASSPTPEVKKAQDEYNTFAKTSPLMLSDVRNNPNVSAEFASGSGRAFGEILSGQQQALSQAVTNALAGQGQQISAGTNAGNMAQNQVGAQQGSAANVAGQTQPQAGAAFFGSPVSGNVVGNGSGGTGNQLIDNAVSNAIGMIKSGSSTSDAMATLGQLGAPAQQALISAMRKYDPSWNITSSNAIAQQNMSQGQEYQAQATQLSTTLKQLDTLEPTIKDFLSKSGLNQENNPFFNKAINDYKSQLQNPADVKSLNAMMADVKTYTAQILGNSGLNPTEVSSTVNSFDPSLLTGTQLTSFLSNLRNLGQIRLQPIQQASQSSYGGSGGFMGATANPSATSNSALANPEAPGITTQNEPMQAILGTVMSAGGSIKGLAGYALSFLK